jgi:hypothetical protein
MLRRRDRGGFRCGGWRRRTVAICAGIEINCARGKKSRARHGRESVAGGFALFHDKSGSLFQEQR